MLVNKKDRRILKKMVIKGSEQLTWGRFNGLFLKQLFKYEHGVWGSLGSLSNWGMRHGSAIREQYSRNNPRVVARCRVTSFTTFGFSQKVNQMSFLKKQYYYKKMLGIKQRHLLNRLRTGSVGLTRRLRKLNEFIVRFNSVAVQKKRKHRFGRRLRRLLFFRVGLKYKKQKKYSTKKKKKL